MMDGAATAAGFYLGLTDDVTPKLRKLRRNYTSFITDLLKSNARVQKSIDASKGMMREAAMAHANGSAIAAPRSPVTPQKFQLNLEPKRGLGLIRKLFPSAREYMQKFVGKLIPLAKGGMVKDPTAALIGEGGQPEAVIPLNKMQGFFSRTLSKAITDAGKLTGAGGGSMGKASHVRDIIVAFTESEKQLRNLVKFTEDGVASGRSAAQDAHRMATIIAQMRKDEFGSSQEKARFVKTLKGNLVPAVEKMRKQASSMRDIFSKNDDLLQQQKDDVVKLGALWTMTLHNLQQGFDAAGRLLETLSSSEARKNVMQTGGVSRGGYANMVGAFTGVSDQIVSSLDLQQIASAFADAGVRGEKALTDYTKNFGRSISMLRDARGVDEKATAQLMYQLQDRIGMSVDSINTFNAGLSSLADSNAVTAQALVDTALATKPLMQGVFRDIGTMSKQQMISGITSAKAALSDRFADLDMNAFVKTLATDMSARNLIGSQIGMSEGDVQAALNKGDLSKIVPGVLTVIRDTMARAGGDKNMQEIQAGQLRAQFGEAFGSMDVETLASLGVEADAINSKFSENQLVMADAVKSTNALTDAAKATLGPLGLIKNELRNIADKTGLTGIVMTVQELDLIGIGQSVLGLSMAVGGIGGVIGKFLPGLGMLLAKLPLVGVLFKGTAETTARSAGMMGKGVGDMLGRVGVGIGSFIGTVGKGIGGAIAGILSGLGTGLLALAPGLMALAAPPVLIGIAAVAVGLLALGGAVWMLGKGLGAAAPFIKESMTGLIGLFTQFKPVLEGLAGVIMAQAKGIALIIDTVLSGVTDTVVQLVTTFSTVDTANLLAAGPGLAAVGVGFAAFGAGLAAGLVALTAGNLIDKVSSLFGLSPGTGVIGAMAQLTAYVGPLATSFSKLAALPSIISLPQLNVPASYPKEVLDATMRAVPNLRAAAADAAYIQQSVGGDDETKDLLRAMLAALQSIATNGKSRPGGLMGELVAGGVGG